jgi:hypothetical protein
MQHKMWIIWSIIMGFPLLLPAQQKDVTHKTIYVSRDGRATWPGTLKQPVNDLPQAIRLANEAVNNNNTLTGVDILIRKGSYTIPATIEIVAGKTWNSKVPLNIQPYANEQVTFHGGKIIPHNAIHKVTDKAFAQRLPLLTRDKIRQVDLRKAGVQDMGTMHAVGFSRPFQPAWLETFFDGEPGQLARWPNDSSILLQHVLDSGSVPRDGDYSNRGAKFTYAVPNPTQWKEPQKVWISGYFMWGYADDAVALADIDTVRKIMTTAQPTLYGFASGKPWRAWYAYNMPEEIDRKREYYLDADKGMLYFLPPDTLHTLEVSVLETPMIALEGVSNVAIKYIRFTCSRGMGIYMERTKGVRIQGCNFDNLGMMAVCIGKGIKPFKQFMHEGEGEPASRIVGNLQQHIYANTTFDREGGSDNGILDCEIYNMGAGGIQLSGGSRLTLEPGNNFVQNCRIHDYNRIEKAYRPAVWVMGAGNRITHCEIYNAPSMGILIHGNNHLVEYNNIYRVALSVDDLSALYYGRDPSERGHVVRYNYFHHIGGAHSTNSVYHDDGACGMLVYGNVFYKTNHWFVLMGGGSDNSFINNVFIDGKYMIYTDNRLENWAAPNLHHQGLFQVRLDAVNYNKPPYSVQYPELVNYWKEGPEVPKRNVVNNNILYHIEKVVRGDSAHLKFGNNLRTDTDPGFVNAAVEDFRLKTESIVWKQLPGFKKIPFEEIGYHPVTERK